MKSSVYIEIISVSVSVDPFSWEPQITLEGKKGKQLFRCHTPQDSSQFMYTHVRDGILVMDATDATSIFTGAQPVEITCTLYKTLKDYLDEQS